QRRYRHPDARFELPTVDPVTSRVEDLFGQVQAAGTLAGLADHILIAALLRHEVVTVQRFNLVSELAYGLVDDRLPVDCGKYRRAQCGVGEVWVHEVKINMFPAEPEPDEGRDPGNLADLLHLIDLRLRVDNLDLTILQGRGLLVGIREDTVGHPLKLRVGAVPLRVRHERD